MRGATLKGAVLADVSGAHSAISSVFIPTCDWAPLTSAFVTPLRCTWLWLVYKTLMARPLILCCGLRVKISTYQLLRYSVPILIESISNGYTPITIHELKPWVFSALKYECISLKNNTQESINSGWFNFTQLLISANTGTSKWLDEDRQLTDDSGPNNDVIVFFLI